MSKIFEQLVEKRGLTREFLEPRYEECAAPWELPDMAAAENIGYLSVVVCFVMFFVNDMYGFANWMRMKKRQAAEG